MACRSRQRLPAGLTSDSSHALASRACLESRAAIAPPSHDDHVLVEADLGSTVDTASQTHGDVTINRPLVSSPCCKQRSDHKDTGQSEEAISLDDVCRASCWSDRADSIFLLPCPYELEKRPSRVRPQISADRRRTLCCSFRGESTRFIIVRSGDILEWSRHSFRRCHTRCWPLCPR